MITFSNMPEGFSRKPLGVLEPFEGEDSKGEGDPESLSFGVSLPYFLHEQKVRNAQGRLRQTVPGEGKISLAPSDEGAVSEAD